jgi:hypothetical protein
MSLYANLRKQFKDASPELKLNVLRYEMIPPIDAVRGISAVLKQIDPDIIRGLPEEFRYFVDTLSKAGDDLRSILDALTDPREHDEAN